MKQAYGPGGPDNSGKTVKHPGAAGRYGCISACNLKFNIRTCENSNDRPRREAALSGSDGGCDRPFVPLHVQAVRGRYGLYRVYPQRRVDPRRVEGARQTQHLRLRTAGGHPAVRPRDRTDGRGRAHGRSGRTRPDRHQFRLSGAQDRRARGRQRHDARRAEDGRDDAPDRRGGETARDGQDAAGVGRRFEEYRRDRRAVAGRGHCGADDPRPHPGADVPRRGGLDADRRGEAQSAHDDSRHRQRRHRFAATGRRGVRPLRRGRRDDRAGHLRPSVDLY